MKCGAPSSSPPTSEERERGRTVCWRRREYKITVIPLLRVEDVSRKLEDTVMLSFPFLLKNFKSGVAAQMCKYVAVAFHSIQ